MTAFRLAIAQRLGLLVLLLLANGCSIQSRPPLPAELLAMQDNIGLSHWQLSGKLGIRNQQQAKSAYLNWQQCGEFFDIRLSGPLGQGGARLQGSRESVTLQTTDKTSSASNPEQLLQQQLGWSMPISQLHYWVRGIPSPNQGYRNNPDNNGFEQAGWHISYLQLQQVDNLTLPAKAIATHPRLKLTLLLKKWQLDPDCSERP
jgi:outer membrane lipoprotein LolB